MEQAYETVRERQTVGKDKERMYREVDISLKSVTYKT